MATMPPIPDHCAAQNSSDPLEDEGRDNARILEEERVHHIIAIVFLFIWTITAVRFLFVLVRERRRYLSRNVAPHARFRTYLKYRFGHWYAWTSGSSVMLLFGLSASLLVLGGLLHSFLAMVSISDSLWASWIWIAAPDGGNSAQPGGYCVGMLVSMGGMLIFALLVSLITSSFEEQLWHLRHGSFPIVEGDHIVILGWTALTPVVIEELCCAMESRGGGVLVILASEEKPDIERLIQCAQNSGDLCLRNSSVVVRSGQCHCRDDLNRVAVPSARRVLVLANAESSREEADARTLNVLLMLQGLTSAQEDACVVAECCLVRNQRLFQSLAAPVSTMEVLTIQDFVGQLLVESSRQQGLSAIITETLGFEGDEFYIAQVSGLQNRRFGDLLYAFPEAVPVGLIRSSGSEAGPPRAFVGQSETVTLLPNLDELLTGNERLVLLAEDRSKLPSELGLEDWLVAKQTQDVAAAGMVPREGHVIDVTRHKQLVVILGWNESVDSILSELDQIVGARSKIVIYSPRSASEREEFILASQKRRKYSYRHISIEHREGPLGARYKLEDLPLQEARKIFVLAESTAASASEADGHSIAAVLQVRDILTERCNGAQYDHTVLMPQVLSKAAEEACFSSGIVDCIDSNRLSARVLASVCEDPDMSAVWGEFLSESTGARFCIRRISEYLFENSTPPEKVCFNDVTKLASCSGEIAIGWSLFEAENWSLVVAEGAHVCRHWELNPKQKDQYRKWGPNSLIAAVSPSRGRTGTVSTSRFEQAVTRSLMPKLRLTTNLKRRSSSASVIKQHSTESFRSSTEDSPSLPSSYSAWPSASGRPLEGTETEMWDDSSPDRRGSGPTPPSEVSPTADFEQPPATAVPEKDTLPSDLNDVAPSSEAIRGLSAEEAHATQCASDTAETLVERLCKLADLRAQGFLSEYEFSSAKSRLLHRIS